MTLFVVDEVHCVPKSSHDFWPAYRQLSIETLQHDIPIMALTAIATHHVREDILCSSGIKEIAKIVLNSFFRPN